MQAPAGNPPAPGAPVHYLGPYAPVFEPLLLALDRRARPWANVSHASPAPPRFPPGALVAVYGTAGAPVNAAVNIAGYVVCTPPDATGIARIHWICAHPTFGNAIFQHLNGQLQGPNLRGYETWVVLSPAIPPGWDLRAMRFFAREMFIPVANHHNPPAPAAVARDPIEAAGSVHILMRRMVPGVMFQGGAPVGGAAAPVGGAAAAANWGAAGAPPAQP